MDIRKKENEGTNISIKLDRKNYSQFIKDIKNLGKKYEHLSNIDKLNYSVLANCQKLPYMKVKGWSSRVVDDNGKISEIIFMDYDNILFRLVESELKYLMEEYNLPPWYVFVTEESVDPNGEVYGNFICINLGKKTFREVVQIQNETHADQAFKKIPTLYRFRTWCLRLGPKGKKPAPKFYRVIGDLDSNYSQEISQGHLEALKGMYPDIPEIKYKNKDGHSIKNVIFDEYITASK